MLGSTRQLTSLQKDFRPKCRVLQTTYPTLQRTFVVTYVIPPSAPSSTVRPNSPDPPPSTPRCSLPSRAHISAHPVAATSPLPTRHCAVGEPRGETLGLGADPGLFLRADADEDAENKAAGRVPLRTRIPLLCDRCAEAFCLACACSGRRAPAPLVWRKTKSKSLSYRDRSPSRSPSFHAHPLRSLAPLPSSPLRAALFSEPYGDDTDASRSTTSPRLRPPFYPASRMDWDGIRTRTDCLRRRALAIAVAGGMRTRRTRCRVCVDVDGDGARTVGAGAVDEEVAGLERQMETSPSTSALTLEAESEKRVCGVGDQGEEEEMCAPFRVPARARGRRWSEKARGT
jgi:hypothetical protein